MLQLKADQQHGDGRRTGDKPAGQAKHHDLSCGDILTAEAPVNILRVSALVGVLPLFFNQRVFVVMMMIMMVVMVMVMVMVVVIVVVMMIVRLALFPGSPRHPQGDRNDQHSGDQLEPGFGRVRIPATTKP